MREFDASTFIRNFDTAEVVALRDGRGGELLGVAGRTGARAEGYFGHPVGLDQITMQPGAQFDLHEHPGDHILYVLDGEGGITIDGVSYPLRAGDSVFVPAEFPHGVTSVGSKTPLRFLAFGVPHRALDSDDRMRLVDLVPGADGAQ